MTTEQTGQEEVVAFLADPATHGIAVPVEVITTHSAHVFLAGQTAYKIKRPVRFNYLDFTALATRKAMIEHELALNAPSAPMIYERVVAITRAPGGGLELDGPGAAVEYALRMHRFARADELTHIADAGRLTDDLARRLGAAVAGYHARAERRGEDGAVLIREILDELAEAFHGMEPVLGAARLERFRRRADEAFARQAPLLSARAAAGRVRRCHSDLHLKNIVLIDGVPVPFDALEFDERLGTCDVAYDFAFLVMDLWHRGLQPQANALLNSYLAETGDLEGLAALPLFLAVRAAIRAMVAVQTMGGAVSAAIAADARRYLDDAIAGLDPGPPRLVAVGGVSGSGKSTLAARLAPALPPVPGAVHLRSDLERKAMLGVAPLARLPAEAYRPEVSRAVYARLMERAGAALAAGHSAIVDATFLGAGERAEAAALAARLGVAFAGLWLTAPAEELERRVAARQGDASDADVAVLRAQLARAPGAGDWATIDAAGDAAAVAARARAALGLG